MARDSSGVYSNALPDVVSGDVIEASWANTTINDIGSEIQDSLSRSGKGNMSAALKVIAGSVSAPGLSFVSEANSGLYRASAADIRMALNSTEAWRVTSAGFRVPADITLANGNVKIGTAAKGIDFSEQTPTAATGAATTAEILNHYEEGAWTPNRWDDSLSSGEGQAHTIQVGMFTRVGRIVFIQGTLAWNDATTGTLTGADQLKIGPLPFTAKTTTNYSAQVYFGYKNNNLGSESGELVGTIDSNTNYIKLWWVDPFSSSSFSTTIKDVDNFSGVTEIRFSGHYFI